MQLQPYKYYFLDGDTWIEISLGITCNVMYNNYTHDGWVPNTHHNIMI